MRYKLSKFCYTWDQAALDTLGSEFDMHALMAAQKVTASSGESILDDILFDGGRIVEVPEQTVQEVQYFKAPWDE